MVHENDEIRERIGWQPPQEVEEVTQLPGVGKNSTIQLQKVLFDQGVPVGLMQRKKNCIVLSGGVIAGAVLYADYEGQELQKEVYRIAKMQYAGGRTVYWIYFGTKPAYEYDPGESEKPVAVTEETRAATPATPATPEVEGIAAGSIASVTGQQIFRLRDLFTRGFWSWRRRGGS